jgi:hypothetical protein
VVAAAAAAAVAAAAEAEAEASAAAAAAKDAADVPLAATRANAASLAPHAVTAPFAAPVSAVSFRGEASRLVRLGLPGPNRTLDFAADPPAMPAEVTPVLRLRAVAPAAVIIKTEPGPSRVALNVIPPTTGAGVRAGGGAGPTKRVAVNIIIPAIGVGACGRAGAGGGAGSGADAGGGAAAATGHGAWPKRVARNVNPGGSAGPKRAAPATPTTPAMGKTMKLVGSSSVATVKPVLCAVRNEAPPQH